jgi:hypothetical protein
MNSSSTPTPTPDFRFQVDLLNLNLHLARTEKAPETQQASTLAAAQEAALVEMRTLASRG